MLLLVQIFYTRLTRLVLDVLFETVVAFEWFNNLINCIAFLLLND